MASDGKLRQATQATQATASYARYLKKSSKIRKIRNPQQRGVMKVVYLISHDIRINNKQSTHNTEAKLSI